MSSGFLSPIADALRWFFRTLGAGLLAVLPLVITVYLIGWLAVTAEQILGGVIQVVLPDGPEGSEPYYLPGMGIAVAIVLLLLVGISLQTYLVRRAIEWEDKMLRKIPLIRTLYTSIKDLASYFNRDKRNDMGETVLVTLPGTEVQLIGFVTRRDLSDLNGWRTTDDPVMVYLPMSYQIGGYLLIVPQSAIQPLDASFDDAMSFVLMAGMRDVQIDGQGQPGPHGQVRSQDAASPAEAQQVPRDDSDTKV